MAALLAWLSAGFVAVISLSRPSSNGRDGMLGWIGIFSVFFLSIDTKLLEFRQENILRINRVQTVDDKLPCIFPVEVWAWKIYSDEMAHVLRFTAAPELIGALVPIQLAAR